MVKEFTQMLRDHGAVEYGRFTLASGEQSTYYIDVKTAITDPDLLARIGAEVAKITEFDVVAGVAVGGVPIAVATSLMSRRPYAIIRSREKDHGKSGSVIGDVSGKRVLLVEDVTTSGGSAVFGINALRAAGAEIECVITVVDREQGARERLREERVNLHALVIASELIER
ncbi:MAG: orotate phosphoribosyltransferase [Methanoregulaceae archaeon]|nr:orotate phosphoribosyltransferase [Methanoregulaceae archaeon]